MKVLIACEYSGTVRDAFIKRGHEAVSCDLQATSNPGPHYQGDVLDILNDGWDLMVGHPPCTYLSYAATHVWNNPGRLQLRLEALNFFAKLWEAPIKKICLENPKGCASPTIAKYSQEIQPFYFGDPHIKTTWLWLKNLPLLTYTIVPNLFDFEMGVEKPQPIYTDKSGKKRYFVDAMGGGNNVARQLARSKTFPGIARAMSLQWG